MANTYTLIATQTVAGSAAASISFSSIPAKYTDLKFFISARGSQASVYAATFISFNGSTASFSNRELYGTGSAGGTSSSAISPGTGQGSIYINGSTATASTFNNSEIYIPNYSSTTLNKSYSCETAAENNATANLNDVIAGLWSNTAAINQVTFTPQTGNFAIDTSISLYGISKS
jgi:hypothetical protein